jgi:hypothetical protein
MTTYVHGIIGIRLQDTEGKIVSHELFVNCDDSKALSDVVTVVQAYCVILDSMTDAAGVQARFTLLFPSTGLKTGATVENPLESGGLMAFSQTGSPYKFSVLVPSMAEALITDGAIAIGEAAFIAWKNWILGVHTGIQCESKARNLLSAFLSCQLSTRKHRKARTKVSYTPA